MSLRLPGTPTYAELRAAVISLVGFALPEPRFDPQLTKFYGDLIRRLGVDSPFLSERLAWAERELAAPACTAHSRPRRGRRGA